MQRWFYIPISSGSTADWIEIKVDVNSRPFVNPTKANIPYMPGNPVSTPKRESKPMFTVVRAVPIQRLRKRREIQY
jgi:hypothetical protein